MSEIAERYRRRARDFERKVAAVQPHQWSNQSPCEHWDARAVVGHIIDMHAAMLRPLGRALRPAPSLAEDPLAAFKSARADVEEILDDARLARTECDTPTGRITAERHIDQVVSDDLVLHGWDLAKATGQDDTMDSADVERIWSRTKAIPAEFLERLRTPGAFGPGVEVFGPEVPVADGAAPQDRLLGLIGRDPGWSADAHDPPGTTVTTPTDTEIVMTRWFAAPPELVFAAWTEPTLLTRWYGARGWDIVECHVDLRVGGRWRFTWRGPDGERMSAGGVYQEIAAPDRLVYSEEFDDHWYPGESIVAHAITGDRGGTTLTTTLQYPTRDVRDLVLTSPMERGVDEGYRRLDDVLVTMAG